MTAYRSNCLKLLSPPNSNCTQGMLPFVTSNVRSNDVGESAQSYHRTRLVQLLVIFDRSYETMKASSEELSIA